MYDVIIAGTSFAGLAVAREIKGKVLLVDRKKIGQGQTSACVTFRPVIEEAGAEDSILQEFTKAVLHIPSKTLSFKINPPFCSFDYERFCQSMLRRVKADTLIATVKSLDGDRVLTDKGDFHARVTVDSTGWRGVLASSIDNSLYRENKRRLSFGYETVLPYQDEKLHFYYQPKLLGRGYAWIFPCGEKTRFGIGSYTGKTDLKREFSSFLSHFDLEMDSLHGGFFPHRLRKPVVEELFVVGDAAGMCFPGSGEGIRQAIFFGRRCGQLIQKILDGKIELTEGLKAYETLVYEKAKYYSFLFNFQRLLMFIPPSIAIWLASYIHRRFDFFLGKYLNITKDESNI